MDTRTKTFHYKAAQPSGGAGTFQAMLESAFSAAPKIKNRQQPLDSEGQHVRFVTLTRKHKGMLFGVAATYTKGQNQAVVAMNENASEVPLEQIAPPSNQEGQRTEFVEGTAYFGILNNHIVLLQSMTFRAKQLEEYFNWLLRRGIPANQSPPQVKIVDVPRAEFRKRKVKGVRAITLSAPIEFETHTDETAGTKKKSVVLEGKGLGLKWLTSAMDDIHEGFSDSFAFKDALETGDVEVRLEVIYHKRSKDDGKVMLDDIAAALTHADVEYEMDVPGYGQVGSSQLKIRDDFTVEAPGGLPLAASVFKQFAQWLENLISGGMVEP